MESYINKRIQYIILKLFTLSILLSVGTACSDSDTEEGYLEIESPTMTVGAASGTVTVNLNTNKDWKIGEVKSNWFELSSNKGSANGSFDITYHENAGIKSRSAEFYIVTVDGRGYQKFNLIQTPSNPFINPELTEIEVGSRARVHSINVESNIPGEVIQISKEYDVIPDTDWIVGEVVENGVLRFSTALNNVETERTATIVLLYEDTSVNGSMTSASIEITQMAKGNDGPPTLKDFGYVKTLSPGVIDENIYIKGHIVANGASSNFDSNTYIIQDENNIGIVFKSSTLIPFSRFDNVELLLDGTMIENVTSSGYSHPMITSISAANVLKQTPDPLYSIKEMYIKDLTDDYLFSMVTLKDVELAIPFGGYTNFNEGYLKDPHTRNYPHTLRDINGDVLHMLTNREVEYRKNTVPQGSGKITGIIVRDNDNYYGDLGSYSIRQLAESDVAIDPSRDQGFSKVLVEWDCEKPAGMVDGVQHIPPHIGDPNAVLSKSESTGFYSAYNATSRIYFLAKYRGDATGGSVTNGGYVSTQWNTDHYWIIDKVSTLGINKPLSLQLEANSSTNDGARDFVVEYSIDGGATWVLIADYSLKGQISGAVKNNTVIPGFKIYNFNLPDILQNQANIKIRLRCASMINVNGVTAASLGTGRLVHLSIKYNK